MTSPSKRVKKVSQSGIASNSPGASTATPKGTKNAKLEENLLERRLRNALVRRKLDLSVSKSIVHNESEHRYQLFPSAIFRMEDQACLSGLHELWLTNHKIAYLPPSIQQLHSLRVLGLGGNKLFALPSELTLLGNLEELYLEDNCMSDASALTFSPSIRHLRLDRNSFTTLPEVITNLRLLNRLGLSYNKITEIPSEIRRLSNLIELDLDYNNIKGELPVEMRHLKSLERIGLEGNQLSERPSVLVHMPQLQLIRLHANPFVFKLKAEETKRKERVSAMSIEAH